MARTCKDPIRGGRARDYVLGRLAETEGVALEDHLVGCEACAEEVLELEAGWGRLEGDLSRAAPSRPAVWGLLARTVLRPVPALVYLVALLLAYPVFRVVGPAGRPQAPSAGDARALSPVVPRTVRLVGEPLFRGDRALREEPYPPTEIPWSPVREDPLLLELQGDVRPEDLPEAGAVLRVEILEGDRPVWWDDIGTGDLDERGVLRLLLAGDGLFPGRVYVLRVRLVEDDRPPEHVVFRRSFLLREGASASPRR